ncbi:unnamed protein product, partial [Didymodactylos carnosus]
YYQKTLAIAAKNQWKDHELIALVYMSIATTFTESDKWEEALSYYEKALTEYMIVHDEYHFDIITVYNKIGYTCAQLNLVTEAFKNFVESFKRQTQRATLADVQAKKAVASAHYCAHTRQWMHAIEYYEKAIDMSQVTQPYDLLLSDTYIYIARTLFGIDLYSESLEKFKKALVIVVNARTPDQQVISKIYLNIGQIH